MNLFDLSPNQLKRAAAIKEQIDRLNAELRRILGASNNSQSAQGKTRTMSAAAKRKIAAAQKARWANFRRGKSGTRASGKATKNAKSPATRAKLSAKMKAYWAAKRAGKGVTGKNQTKAKS